MSNRSARVGIVMRTKDRPDFVHRAIADVLAQRYEDWQIVLANDGGSRVDLDRVTRPHLPALAGRLTVIDVRAPNGRCAAANQAIDELSTPYLVLHDDDDRWHPDFLAETVAWLDSNPGDAGVMVPTEIVYERDTGAGLEEVGRAPYWAGLHEVTFFDLLTVNRAVPISFLYRRALHDELGGYDESLDAVEDWEFYLRVTLAHRLGFIVGRPLAFWSQRPDARGASGNSMFALGDIHARSDAAVRDRAIRAYAAEHGMGLPLQQAALIAPLRAQLHEIEQEIAKVRDALHSVERWSAAGIIRRLRARMRGRKARP